MSAYASAGRLYVADFNNNRVLVWSSIPTTNVAATAVLGQPDMTTGTSNTGGISAQTLVPHSLRTVMAFVFTSPMAATTAS